MKQVAWTLACVLLVSAAAPGCGKSDNGSEGNTSAGNAGATSSAGAGGTQATTGGTGGPGGDATTGGTTESGGAAGTTLTGGGAGGTPGGASGTGSSDTGGATSGGANIGGGDTGGAATGGTGTGGTNPNPPAACDTSDLVEPTGRTLRVSPTGTDTGDCSTPCSTLQYAADQAEPRTLVLVANGTYAGFRLSDQHGITFRADGNAVIVEGDEVYWGRAAIDIEASNDVRIEGFIVQGSTGEGIRVTGNDVVLLGNVVRNNGERGILTGFAERLRIIRNVTYGNQGEHGIYVSNSNGPDDAPVICGNESYDNNVNGIQLNGDCHAGGDGTLDNAVVANNLVYQNGAKGLSIISAPGVLIVNNVIYDNRQNGSGAGGIHLVNEPGCDDGTQSSSNGIVANNTVVEPGMAAIRCTLGATGNRIFNNVLVGTSSFATADEVGGNAFSSTNIEQSDTTGLALDAEARYVPLSDSPAVDQGETAYEGAYAPATDFSGNTRPAGTTFDVGAHEVQ